MSVPLGTKKSEDDIVELKQKAIDYFRTVSVVKYAAMFIKRDEDTLHKWMKEDPDFAYQMHQARSENVTKRVKKVKDEFYLERVEKEVFAERTEVTGKDGKDLIIPIFGGMSAVQEHGSDQKDLQSPKKD